MTRSEYLARAREFASTKNRRFTEDQVRSIRENRRGMTDRQQADTFGCHPNTIYNIRHRIKYAGVS